MKTYVYFIIFFIIHTTQAQIIITMEDAYSFKRINSSYVLLESSSIQTAYHSNKDGVISLTSFTEDTTLTFYSEAHEPIQTHFKATESLHINVILAPKSGFVPKKSKALIQGFVYDKVHGKPLKNVIIRFSLCDLTIKTDSLGEYTVERNQLEKLQKWKEGELISYTVSAKNYQTENIEYKFNTETCFTGIGLKPIDKPILVNTQSNIDWMTKIRSSFAQRQLETTNFNCDNLPSSIRVGTSCSCNTCTTVSVMDIEIYVRKGLNDEWIASWNMESLKSGSLPYKTYGAYHVLHPINTNYDISDTTCKQVWDSDYSNNCISACAITEGQYLVTSTNTVAFTEYSAENNGLNAPTGEGCGDGSAGNGTTSPCISDIHCSGHDRYGHGRGMCQWGTQRWALQGKTYQWIADHYYNPVNIYRCDETTTPSLDCSNAVAVSCNTSYHGNSSTAPSNVGQYSCNTWTETGPERVHSFIAPSNGSFTVTISNFTGDLDVYILGSCDPSDCLGTVNSSSATYVNAISGDTYYIVVDADDGSGSAYDLIINCEALPVEEISLQSDISIFPNPSKGIFTISTQQLTIKKIQLFTNLGQLVLETTSLQMDLSSFPVGFYYVEIETTENRKSTFKIIKN